MRGTGWLWLGAVLGLLVPATGVHRALVRTLGDLIPLPWGEVLVGVLVFAACAALYFRSHWAASARAHREALRRAGDGARRLVRIAEDVERSAFVITDNLAEAATGDAGRRGLFLDGARAHAERLPSIAQRCRGVASRLRPDEGQEDVGSADEQGA